MSSTEDDAVEVKRVRKYEVSGLYQYNSSVVNFLTTDYVSITDDIKQGHPLPYTIDLILTFRASARIWSINA